MEYNIWCASGPELSILATTISIYISEFYDAADLNTLAAFVTIIGDTLALLAVQKDRCENSIISATQTDTTTTPTINNLFQNPPK